MMAGLSSLSMRKVPAWLAMRAETISRSLSVSHVASLGHLTTKKKQSTEMAAVMLPSMMKILEDVRFLSIDTDGTKSHQRQPRYPRSPLRPLIA